MNYSFIKSVKLPILTIVVLDLVFLLIIYSIHGKLVYHFIATIILISIMLAACLLAYEIRKSKYIKEMISEFYQLPNYNNLDKLTQAVGNDYKNILYGIYDDNKKTEVKLESQRTDLLAYRDIIELWAHEIKTPITLVDLVLENHANEMSAEVHNKISTANLSIKNDVERILYYARYNSSKKDYKLEKTSLMDAVIDALNIYYPVLAESDIVISTAGDDYYVMTDHASLVFIISQIISNSIKYTRDKITIISQKNQRKIGLLISNNGPAIAKRDLAFIFEKGYRGSHSKNTNSTGIGLYLTKSIADDLGITIDIVSNTDGNFTIGLFFKSI